MKGLLELKHRKNRKKFVRKTPAIISTILSKSHFKKYSSMNLR